MAYQTLKATVQSGRILLLDPINLPANTPLLVTVLNDVTDFDELTLGEHLINGLEDVLYGRVTVVDSSEELNNHLNTIFSEV